MHLHIGFAVLSLKNTNWQKFGFGALTVFEFCSYHHLVHFNQASRAQCPLPRLHRSIQSPPPPPLLVIEEKHGVRCHALSDCHLLCCCLRGRFCSAWGTAHLRAGWSQCVAPVHVNHGGEDVQASAGLDPLDKIPPIAIFCHLLYSPHCFCVMLNQVGYWEALAVCLLSARSCSSSVRKLATLE